MGLIAKAVDKVEKKEASTPARETPPEPEAKKPKAKKKMVIAGAALLVIAASLGLAYLLVLKPASQPPPKLTRRSISARQRLTKPAPAAAQDKKDEATLKAGTPGKAGTSAEVSRKAPVVQEQVKGAGVVKEAGSKAGVFKEEPSSGSAPSKDSKAPTESETVSPPVEAKAPVESSPETSVGKQPEGKDAATAAAKTPAAEPETKAAAQAADGPPPDAEAGPQIFGPRMDELQDIEVPATAGEEQGFPTGEMTSPDPEEDSEWDVTEEVEAPPVDEIPMEAMLPAQVAKTTNVKPDRALEVSERSESRSERYYKKGVSYQRQGDLGQAIDSYRRALNFNPDHLQANVNLSIAYLQAGRFKEAEQILVYLYASRPKDSKILYNFGVLLYQTGELASAESKLKRLLEIDPFHLEANLLLASIHEEKGEMDKALEFCLKAHQINSADPQVLYRLGRAWDLTGEPGRAAEYYRLYLDSEREKERDVELTVRDRLKYLISQGGEK
jgi:Flp pilus assembly protein TadD